MKLVIADACILIDLDFIQLTSLFCNSIEEIHTTFDVFSDLSNLQKENLLPFTVTGKLQIHSILETDRIQISKSNFPNCFSMTDKTAIFLARTLNATIISNDKPIRNYAINYSIPYPGIIWIIDHLVEKQLITPTDGSAKLQQLIVSNRIYRYNPEINNLVSERVKIWNQDFKKN